MEKLKVKRFGDGVGKPKQTCGKKIEPGISWTRRMIDKELPDLPEFEPAAAENIYIHIYTISISIIFFKEKFQLFLY